jgi:hypothetical protein
MATFDELIAAGVDLCFYGTNDSAGYLVGANATPPANGNTNGSGMARLRGIVSADVQIEDPETVDVPGDNRSQGQFLFEPARPPSFLIENSVFKLSLHALVQGTLVYGDGDINTGVLQPDDPVFPDMCWLLQSPAKKKDIALNGVKAWGGVLIPSTQVYARGRNAFNNREAARDRYRVTANPAGVRPDGLLIDNATYGSTAAPLIEFQADNPVHMHTFRGNGTQAAFILEYTPAAASSAKVRVRVNGTLQVYTTNYTVNVGTKTITFAGGSIPAPEAKIVVFYEFVP